ncbi:type IV toxin-antitoxin system AbiEi family antitoxin [Paenarthrobacter nicotinovorans]|uniref:type IV toxin-antitoxin system AbiEi family antitoxin n=1 Tax=Paenarthrobacter nicotinovorans TaxID=29320 RepID=UPI00047B0D0A|nr:type IV toxin-antitoxin system AbiEi family antitoxin [Paenarthrobacter nicotinovorans]
MDTGSMFHSFQEVLRQRGWRVDLGPPKTSADLPTYLLFFSLDGLAFTQTCIEIAQYPLPISLITKVARDADADFVLAPKIGPTTSSELRRLSINHADLTGRLSLRSPGVILEVEGLPGGNSDGVSKAWLREHNKGRSIDLTSTKTAQLVFCILNWPKLLAAPSRLIADVAGVSLGLVPRTLRHLEEIEMVHGRRWMGSGRSIIAHAWLAAYRNRLGPSLHIATMETPLLEVLEANTTLGGGFAVPWLIRPRIGAAYVAELSDDLVRASRLRKSESPNVEVRKKFWRSPPAEFLEGPHRAGEQNTAPPLLVYADLSSSLDQREQEAARVYLQEEPELQWLRGGSL